MDDSPITHEVPTTNHRATPWGAIIGILLILGIVVAGAYYALTDRLAEGEVSAATSSQ